jgi:hypothetical protein
MFPRTALAHASQSENRVADKPVDAARSAWDRVRKHLEEERYRITREIGQYPTPIPACDQDYNHMLAERERVNAELTRLDEAEKQSAGAADPRAAIEAFVRSSPYFK